jgi:carboxyl-terminal processing protease
LPAWFKVVSLLSLFLFALVAGLAASPLGCASASPGTIGALLGKRTDGRLFVRGVPPGQGADRAGLEIDDEIVAIEGHAVREMSEEEIRGAVRGDVGSALSLTVERGGQRREVKVQRSPILAEKADRPGRP